MLFFDMYDKGYEFVKDEQLIMYDTDVAESLPCSECGGKMHYEGYSNEKSYRAFAVCNQCGNQEEF